MTFQELIAKIPKELQPAAIQYGPMLLRMTGAELFAWMQLLGAKADDLAFRAVTDKMTEAELVAEMDNLAEANANETAAVIARRDVVLSALKAVLEVLLALGAAAVAG